MENEIIEKSQSKFVIFLKENKKIIILVASIILLVLGLGFRVYYVQQKKLNNLVGQQKEQISSLKEQVQRLQIIKTPSNTVNNTTPQNTAPQKVDTNKTEIDEVGSEKKVVIDWGKELVEIKEANCPEGSSCFMAGKVIQGDEKLVGRPLFLEMISGMGYFFKHYVIYEKDEKSYKMYFEDTKTSLNGINDIPEEISFPDTDYKLTKYSWISKLYSEIKIKKKMFTNGKLGDFYLSEDGCLVVELPDHTAQAYDIVIPFVNKEDKVPNFKFNGGEKNNQEYQYIRPTCGSVCTYYSEAKDIEGSLKVVAKASNSEDIFTLKDTNNKLLKEIYDDKNTVAYFGENWDDKLENNKYSYAEFISMHPLLFWKDPLGRWIQFKNEKFQIAAEMCKPVMYFYSPDNISLNVKVNPNGGFTHTDPVYDGGWNIEVVPGGKVKDNKTGRMYESLLWEGMALGYSKPESGWVVKNEELDSFFNEKLNKLGLNDKEISDFKSYWLERLNDKAYYKISFLDQRDFDKLAPLEFYSAQPNKIIRVMMIAEGVDDYFNISEQLLPATPAREGFTVVEWGGILER